MATPHVTGVVALVRSLHPDWTNDQVISQILDTVDGITGLPTITSGRVNAAGAVGNPSPDSTGPRIVGSDPAVFTINTLSHIRLQFSEAIDLSTVSVDDVVNLQGPSGAIPILSITPVAGTSRQIDVNFAPQTAVGQYQLVVGPNIADRAGNLMNQDGDELFGELPEDEYTTQFSILSGLHFDSFEVPAPISGFTIVGSSLVVDRDIVIGDLNVTVNIFYPDVRDLMLLLVSPAGNATYLSFLDGAAGLGFVNTTFDDEAAGSITTGTSPFTGSFRPNNPVSGSARPLSRFDGESMLGTWTLWVQNFQFTSSFGILTAWSLDVTPATGPPPDDGTNQPPVAQNDSIEATAGGPVTFDARVLLDNDSDPDGDILAIVGVHDGSGGTVQLNGNGTITFTPAEDFVGTGDFEYIISDGLATAVGHVTVNVGAQFLWHNRNLNVDVDGDEEVTANDVLMIINIINAVGSTSLVGLSSLSHSNLYLDVTADDFVAADDVMEVINYINAHPDQAPPDQAEPGQPPDSEIDTALLSLLTEGSTKRK
jgi:subtilisin-like proprotein convertase family protein